MKQAVRKPKLETLKPTVNGSTYLRPDKMEWKPTQFEKTWIKVLYEDKTKGEMTCLIKLEPGDTCRFTSIPSSSRRLYSRASMYDHDGTCRAGEFVWRKPNSFHENHSDEGALIFAVYRKPNIYHHSVGFDAEQE